MCPNLSYAGRCGSRLLAWALSYRLVGAQAVSADSDRRPRSEIHATRNVTLYSLTGLADENKIENHFI